VDQTPFIKDINEFWIQ